MRILHTESATGFGGQERRVLLDLEEMQKRGHEVGLVTWPNSPLTQRTRGSNIALYEVRFAKNRALLLFFQLLRVIRSFRPDVVHTHSSFDSWMGGVAAKYCGVPVLRSRHLFIPVRNKRKARLLYGGLADHVLTTCTAAAEDIRKATGLSSGHCESLPTAILPPLVKEDPGRCKARFSIAPGTLVVGTVCILRGWKGVADLIDAVSLLAEKKDIHLLIVGSGPRETELRSQARKRGLEYTFTGFLEDPSPAIGAMDIFCLLSREYEGVSQAAQQACWMEKPLVTTGVGGLAELCVPNRTGLLVPPCSSELVAEVLRKLLASASLRQELGVGAKVLVEEFFSYKKMTDRLERVYRDLKKSEG